MTDEKRPLSKRLLWFVALWLVGVGATGVVALIIKLWLRA